MNNAALKNLDMVSSLEEQGTNGTDVDRSAEDEDRHDCAPDYLADLVLGFEAAMSSGVRRSAAAAFALLYWCAYFMPAQKATPASFEAVAPATALSLVKHAASTAPRLAA